MCLFFLRFHISKGKIFSGDWVRTAVSFSIRFPFGRSSGHRNAISMNHLVADENCDEWGSRWWWWWWGGGAGGRGFNAHFAFSPGRNKTGRNRWRSKKEKNPSTAKPKQKVEQHLTRRCLFKSRSSRVDGRRPMNGRRRREKESWLPADGDAVISLFFRCSLLF